MKKFERIVEYRREDHELFALATHVLSIPRVPTQALVVFPGMGEDERVVHAVKRWSNDDNLDYLLVAGLNLNEKTARRFDIVTLRSPPFNLPMCMEGGVFTQVESGHTQLQAQWTAKMVRELKISSLTITAPAYHLTRAYLTLLHTLLKDVDWPVWLIPDPTPVSPWREVPELEGFADDRGPAYQHRMVPGEGDRILEYQKESHVTNSDVLLQYFRVLYSVFIQGKQPALS